MNQLFGLIGIAAILAIAWLLSTNRKAIRLRVVGAAFALQATIAWLVIYTSWGRAGIQGMSDGVANLLGYATQGTEFLFGPSETNPLANTFAIATFALSGFANFSSIAIQMAVTGGLAPNQRPMIAKLGIRALIAGSLANLMSAALAGLMISA